MASISASPFSLRPWPTGDKKPKNLGEFIARVNAERGGFRNVTEAELREEAQAQDEGRLTSANGSPGGESDSDDDAEADKSKTIIEAREEFLRNIEMAHQSAMHSLDFVSLLLSKETPNQANTTLSPALRDMVGFGVLGASKHQESNITQARMQDDLAVATGWRLMGTNKMVDSVIEAAERLEKEISLETKYWADVLAVSDNGWTVASLPYESHTLGVRYGFAESAPEYRNSSIAPLRRSDDGTAQLGNTAGAGGAKRVRVLVERDGKVTGKSRLPGRVPENAPLQDRVLEARNTIFAEELWYEINKEARTLLSLNVRSTDSGLVYDVDAKTKITLSLEDLSEPEDGNGQPDSILADTAILGLHFLLIFNHRMQYFKRTQSTQAAAGRNNATHGILRPLLARLTYDSSCSVLTSFLTGLKVTLHGAGLSSMAFTQSYVPPEDSLSHHQLSQLYVQAWRATPSESLIINLAQLLELTVELTITPEARLTLRGKSFASPVLTTMFRVTLPGSTGDNQATQGQDQTPDIPNPLEESYPPYGTEPYPNVHEAIYYVRQAATRAIVAKLSDTASEQLEREDIVWSETMTGPTITARDNKELRLEIRDTPALALVASMKWMEGKDLKSRQVTWTATSQSQEAVEEVVVNFFRN
ncbi:hypothetical protein JX266_005974 [Neoarthrinium moseri]|nr:hypothetical protein JX266_005974 [Neoarthrinium moseri]